MKHRVSLFSLMFILLTGGGIGLGQSPAGKNCAFNIVGMWQKESPSPHDVSPMIFRFSADGEVTMMTHFDGPGGASFEVTAGAEYELDNPGAPTRITFTTMRGNEVFARGATSLEIMDYGDDAFTLLDPEAGQTRWVRLKAHRYILTFAARGGSIEDGGPAFVMWTVMDGRKTEIDVLGLFLTRDKFDRTVPNFGPIPPDIYKDFLRETGKESDVMMRFDLSEAEYLRTHRVFQIWDKYVKNYGLLYDDHYLNGMEFIRRTAESLNQCGEKVRLHKLDWSITDEIVTKYNLPKHPLVYIQKMREMNPWLHLTDDKAPEDWAPARRLPGP